MIQYPGLPALPDPDRPVFPYRRITGRPDIPHWWSAQVCSWLFGLVAGLWHAGFLRSDDRRIGLLIMTGVWTVAMLVLSLRWWKDPARRG